MNFLQVENDTGSLIPEVSGLLQYRIPKDAIGKFISFTCTPVRDDGVSGEPRTCTGQERIRPGNFTKHFLKKFGVDLHYVLEFTVFLFYL